MDAENKETDRTKDEALDYSALHEYRGDKPAEPAKPRNHEKEQRLKRLINSAVKWGGKVLGR